MNNEQQLIFLRGALKVVQDNPVTPYGYCFLIGYTKVETGELMAKAVSKIVDFNDRSDNVPVTRLWIKFIGKPRVHSIFSPNTVFHCGGHNYIAMRTFFAVWLEETIEEAIAELIKK